MSQTEVAAALGVSIWTYHRAEMGARTFDLDWIDRLPAPMREVVVADRVRFLQAEIDRVTKPRFRRRSP